VIRLNPRRLNTKALRTVDYSVYGVGWYEHGNLGMGRSNETNPGNQKHIVEPEQTPGQARVVNPNPIQ
jgi:alpha-tubulin suppressor-like RCC1 family protein